MRPLNKSQVQTVSKVAIRVRKKIKQSKFKIKLSDDVHAGLELLLLHGNASSLERIHVGNTWALVVAQVVAPQAAVPKCRVRVYT